MKANITNETKAKFFAQYWDQRIGVGLNEQVDVVGCNFKAQSAFTETILLKPLSSISDEDAEVIELQSEDYNENGWWDEYEYFYWWSYNDVDYLRSKGYALPYFGLSVKEMVEAGWIKLIK